MNRKTKGLLPVSWIALFSLLVVAGCGSYKQDETGLPDTPERGTIHVSADESFKPIMDALVQVYESNHPGTHILVDFKPEADCLKDMLNDSTRVIIATRPYSAAEKQLVIDSLQVEMRYSVVARDAIAVIVNPERADSFFTTQDIKDILQGKFKENLIPVFDGLKATSTVRFIIDSVLHGDTLGKNVVAARSSEEVIDYISRTKDAVGFIGVSWIGNKDDPEQLGFMKKVKVVPIETKYNDEFFVIPVQNNIFLRKYPMVRDLVYILKERHRGLGQGFVDFMSGEKGQLIFKRAYLAPAKLDFRMRKAQLKED